MQRIIFLITVILISSLYCTAQQEKSVVLEGKCFRPIDTIILLKSTEDERYAGVKIAIDADSTFKHEMQVQVVEEYSFVFQSEYLNGMWKPIRFYPDGKLISFKLYPPEEYERNTITGSPLTEQKKEYKLKRSANFSADLDYWYDKLYAPNQDPMTKTKAQHNIDSLTRTSFRWQQDYFSKDSSIVGYYEYYEALLMSDDIDIDDNDLKMAHKFWISKFPNHPLSEEVENLMHASDQVVVGGLYVDFDLIKKEDSGINVSEMITKNEYTIIDLWAPWCGPCIKKSKALKENYNTLKTFGVNVIAVIGGINDYSSYKKAKEKYNYPWEVYSEVNNKNKIWSKYGIPYAGGSQFLLNKKGEILAINANIDSIIALTGN